MKYNNLGSVGISVVDPRILGCERALARSHPKIRMVTTANPREPQPGPLGFNVVNYRFIPQISKSYNLKRSGH